MADERTGKDRRQGQITYEVYCEIHGIEPIPRRPDDPGGPCRLPLESEVPELSRRARLHWPKWVDPKPTPTADDLPAIFGE